MYPGGLKQEQGKPPPKNLHLLPLLNTSNIRAPGADINIYQAHQTTPHPPSRSLPFPPPSFPIAIPRSLTPQTCKPGNFRPPTLAAPPPQSSKASPKYLQPTNSIWNAIVNWVQSLYDRCCSRIQTTTEEFFPQSFVVQVCRIRYYIGAVI